MEQWITVKDYAETHGVTIQAVYQQLKRKKNKAFIDKHSKIIKGTKYLDQEAVEYLENQRDNAPSVVIQTDHNEKLEELQRENELLKAKFVELQDKLIKRDDKILELTEKVLLLTQEPPKKRHWWQRRS